MEKGRQDAWQPESTLLRLGIAAARAGHISDARQFFRQVLRIDPHHELAWMWMGGVVETDAERVHCLRQVLIVDPNNKTARRGLEKVEARMVASAAAPKPPPPPERPPRVGGDRVGGEACPSCGTPNRETSNFCTECGRSLTGPTTPPSAPPTVESPRRRGPPIPTGAQRTPEQRTDRTRVLLTIIFVLLLFLLVTVCSAGACAICRTWAPAGVGMG